MEWFQPSEQESLNWHHAVYQLCSHSLIALTCMFCITARQYLLFLGAILTDSNIFLSHFIFFILSYINSKIHVQSLFILMTTTIIFLAVYKNEVSGSSSSLASLLELSSVPFLRLSKWVPIINNSQNS